jgi:hypothetical protein
MLARLEHSQPHSIIITMMRSLFVLAAAFLATATATQKLQFLVPAEFDQDRGFAMSDFASTHYGSPEDGCEDDETAFSIMGVAGSICSPTCTDSPCPTDLPDGVTATPTCALQNPQTGDKYCALICAPENLRRGAGQCGAATCQPIQGTGICTYE